MIIDKHRKTVRAFSVLTCDVTLIFVEKDMFGPDFEMVSRHRYGYHTTTSTEHAKSQLNLSDNRADTHIYLSATHIPCRPMKRH